MLGDWMKGVGGADRPDRGLELDMGTGTESRFGVRKPVGVEVPESGMGGTGGRERFVRSSLELFRVWRFDVFRE